MLFNSIQFVIFFVAVVTIYFSIPHKFRWMLLLAASCYFYMAFIPWYILILFFLIVLDFFLGLHIEKITDKKHRRYWLLMSILSNVGMLFVFKYFNFFNTAFADLFSFMKVPYGIENLSLILPLGLSFHAFQSLSYVIEVYRGTVKAERNIGIYALYVMFFPQLVAGPIERPDHMLPQFREEHRFSFSQTRLGVQRMIWGFFKKIVIADHIALLVNAVYADPLNHTGPSLVLATILFAFQIYCDFSGYCDIALGGAQVLGFKLSENFNAPYLASSISNFWRRWHMTLSSWFRDYVYIPLGGGRATEYKVARNLLIVFALSGLWHGANWTFVTWGVLNGVYLICGRFKNKMFPRWKGLGVFSVISTFALTCLAWIFFRAESMSHAWYIISHLGTGWAELSFERDILLGGVDTELYLVLFGIMVLLCVEKCNLVGFFKNKFFSSPVLKTAGYAILVFLILTLWEGRGTQFIYFQF